MTVLGWLSEQYEGEVFLTALTQAELLYGVELMPAGKRRAELAKAIEQILYEDFAGRILPFDEEAAKHYAPLVVSRKAQGRPLAQVDGMIAAITLAHGATLATRNTKDFTDCGVTLVDPWR